MTPTTFLIDGIDRLGKSSLCKNLQHELGFYQYIHLGKPIELDYINDLGAVKSGKESSLYQYQRDSIYNMFRLIDSDAKLIFDRSHLGEVVYSPLYRNYDGDYAIDNLETYETTNVRLILLITSNFDILTDDGESFNWDNKIKEQQAFIRAFNKSKILDKIFIDVHHPKGGFKSYAEILKEALLVTELDNFKG